MANTLPNMSKVLPFHIEAQQVSAPSWSSAEAQEGVRQRSDVSPDSPVKEGVAGEGEDEEHHGVGASLAARSFMISEDPSSWHHAMRLMVMQPELEWLSAEDSWVPKRTPLYRA